MALTRIVVHAPVCPQGDGHTIISVDDCRAPDVKFHTCVMGYRGNFVVEVSEPVEPHVYSAALMQPFGSQGPVCKVCFRPKHEEGE